MDRRRVGYHVFPARVFVSHSTEKVPRGPLYFRNVMVSNFFWFTVPKKLLQQFGVSENFGYRKNFLKRGITIFCRHFFVSQDRKTSYGNTSVFQKFSGIEKSSWTGGGWGITFFRWGFLSLTVPKNFLEGPLYFRNVMVSNFFG